MMSRRNNPSRKADAGAALVAQYRTTRARLMGATCCAASAAVATTVASARTSPRRSRRRASPSSAWLAELIAFNDELRRLFLRTATRAARHSGERIRDVVAAHFGITFAEIAGDAAIRRCTWPRQVAMYICARHTRLSPTQIGRLFGDRDPSTVRFAVRAVEMRMERDPGLAVELSALMQRSGLRGSA